MTMEDGNTITEDKAPEAAPAAPVINEDRIVQKLFDKFADAQRRPATATEQNALVNIYQDLKAKGMDDEFIASQLGIAKTIEETVLTKVAKAQIENARSRRDSDGFKFIGKVIRDYAREDDRIGEMEDTIRARVAARFNGNEDRLNEWKNFIVNESAIEKIVDEVVADISKKVLGTDRTKPGPAVKPKTSGTSKGDPDDKAKEPVDVASLNEDQLELYYTRVANNQRMKGMTKAEAEKSAFEVAKALPKYNPRAYR